MLVQLQHVVVLLQKVHLVCGLFYKTAPKKSKISFALFSVSFFDFFPIKAGMHTFSKAVNSGNN